MAVINLDLEVEVEWDDVAKVWASYCPAFDCYSQGTTYDEAILAIREAVNLLATAREKRHQGKTWK